MNISNLETGDLILFNGYYFVSNIIEYFSGSIFSHCGVIIKDPYFENKSLTGIYVLESGSEEIADPENNRLKTGVQLTKLDTIINTYYGKLYIRKLNCTRDESFYNKLKQIHSDVHNISYDLDPIDWIKAEFNITIGNIQKLDTFWCSALVTYIYIKLGFLNSDIPWTIITPHDLSSTSHRFHFHNCVLDQDINLNL
jgi:hypothetical protein